MLVNGGVGNDHYLEQGSLWSTYLRWLDRDSIKGIVNSIKKRHDLRSTRDNIEASNPCELMGKASPSLSVSIFQLLRVRYIHDAGMNIQEHELLVSK